MRDAEAWLAAVQGHFEGLIRSTLASYDIATSVAVPILTEALVRAEGPASFSVDGMYGGFSYWLDVSDGSERLIVESWSRIQVGSGLRHAITPGGAILLSRGFV